MMEVARTTTKKADAATGRTPTCRSRCANCLLWSFQLSLNRWSCSLHSVPPIHSWLTVRSLGGLDVVSQRLAVVSTAEPLSSRSDQGVRER